MFNTNNNNNNRICVHTKYVRRCLNIHIHTMWREKNVCY